MFDLSYLGLGTPVSSLLPDFSNHLRSDGQGAGSNVGVVYTDRTEGGLYNRVAAADTRLVFGGACYTPAEVLLRGTVRDLEPAFRPRASSKRKSTSDRRATV